MNHDHSNTNSTMPLWIMLACCLIPLALILAIGVFGISIGSLTPLLPYALILLCPLMMFFMMRGMGHDHGTSEMHHADATRTVSTQGQVKTTSDPASTDTGASPERCH